MNVIITATELASELGQPTAPVVLDVRYQLGGPPGRPVYEAGHVPGAVYVDLESELASPPGPGGRHPLPDLDAFTDAMRAAGVRADRPVVVYDGGQGWASARAWWLLRWTGHPDVRVLDGGLAAWEAAGLALSVDQPAVQKGDFTPVPGGLALLRADDAAAVARRGVLLDARAGERYRGEVEPIDKVAGHIPGAVSAPTTENVVEGAPSSATRRNWPSASRRWAPQRTWRSVCTAAPGSPPPTRYWPSRSRGAGGPVRRLLERVVGRPGPPCRHRPAARLSPHPGP